MGAEKRKKLNIKTNTDPAANWLRFLAIPFGVMLCWGSLKKLIEINTAMSIDNWGTFIAGLLIIAATFVMNRFLSAMLLGTGVFTVVNLFHPDLQNWMNLVLFILLTVLLFQPYRIWIRVIIQVMCLGVIGFCLWCVWNEFYDGLRHFIDTGKLTDAYLNNRIKTYLPGDFSYYMAVTFLVLSIRQYAVPKSKQLRTIKETPAESLNHSSSDNDLWGY